MTSRNAARGVMLAATVLGATALLSACGSSPAPSVVTERTTTTTTAPPPGMVMAAPPVGSTTTTTRTQTQQP